LLAEHAGVFLAALGKAQPAILDIGTGTGCLALQLAKRFPSAKVTAVDISPDALSVARENALLNHAGDNLQFLLSDLFGDLPSDARFDLIVSNPPYIPSAEIETLQPEVRDFDPRLALDGGLDGLDFYRRLAVEARIRLLAGGKLMLEFGDGQAPELERLLGANRWQVDSVIPDYARCPRLMIAKVAE